ncbi:MAG: non-canonical purine NTP pyrophosphatase [Nanoarchaeota archaeon]|nr:non-canonical purine NTP pyrophosphatase [Nanoarchaeota archaeon]
MTLYFITGNSNKLAEAKTIISDIEGLDIDLPEIQEIDPEKIIKEKLTEACKVRQGEFFCEDTSIYLDCLNGFPGPLIKWMLKTLGTQGIYDLVSKYPNHKITAKTIIGYTNGKETKFFSGEVKGTLVKPRGETNFGWDPIFLPDGYDKTFAEMESAQKNMISMRRKSLEKLNEYLDSKP